MFYAIIFVIFGIVLSGCNAPAEETNDIAIVNDPVSTERVKDLVKNCDGCHGEQGVSNVPAVPYIAGQQAEYLIGAIEGYVNGMRSHEAMAAAIATLTRDEVLGIANYYHNLKTAWPKQQKANAVKINTAAVTRGRERSTSCAACHGDNGVSRRANIPSLAGLPKDYFVQAVNSYLNDKRSNPLMLVYKNVLTPADLADLSHYYNNLKAQMPQDAGGANTPRGKQLAEQRCSGCHGVDGNSVNPAIPSLTGQRADYLALALKAYQEKQRPHEGMRAAAKNLSSQDIDDLARYFAAQTPSAVGLKLTGTNQFDPLSEGKQLASTCIGCHGAQGSSRARGTPSLSGLHYTYLASAIKAYQTGERTSTIMKTMVSHLDEVQIEKIALFFASQHPKQTANRGKGSAAAGAKIAEGCAACHGKEGISEKPEIPSLAGQDADYLAAALKSYADGQRHHDKMAQAAKPLDKKQRSDIAAYYAASAPAKPASPSLSPPEEHAQRCDRCHGENGDSTDPTIPRIAGQKKSYLVSAMQAYAAKQRNNSMMHAMTAELTLTEMSAIADYYAKK